MSVVTKDLPLSLYVHIPWCVQKCPYCDFNSHQQRGELAEDVYIDHLLRDLEHDCAKLAGRNFASIFIGGGTPSLFHGKSFARLLGGIRDLVGIAPEAEITMEANPGTFEQERFASFQAAGINRLSLGVQSFQNDKLRKLGRIHDATAAVTALTAARQLGFSSVNCDLMYGLPGQTIADAEFDLVQAIELQPSHISWYNLTIEPNTAFYRRPPPLPVEDMLAEIEKKGSELLAADNYQRYEISAYATAGERCYHNLNYWRFGDYLGIGAGAHSKLTAPDGTISRFWKHKTPNRYQNAEQQYIANTTVLSDQDKIFEFALNALRVLDGFTKEQFTKHTGLAASVLVEPLARAVADGLIVEEGEQIRASEKGLLFLNDLVNLFA